MKHEELLHSLDQSLFSVLNIVLSVYLSKE